MLRLVYTFDSFHSLRDAYLAWADFYTDLAHLDQIDWRVLQYRDFRRDDNDLGKTDRYQAEALDIPRGELLHF